MTDAELITRLERLERDNRRLKRLGAAALVLVAALGAIAATRPVPQRIAAHGFDLVDDTGAVRAALTMEPPMPAGIQKSLRSIGVRRNKPGPSLLLRQGHTAMGLLLDANGLSITTLDRAGNLTSATLDASGLSVFGDRPSVSLTDRQGFSMALGSTATHTALTGETQQTSADSVVMFGNDKEHHVIWKAP